MKFILTPELPSTEKDEISFHFKRGLHLQRFDPSRRLVDPGLRWIYASIGPNNHYICNFAWQITLNKICNI